jgi:hypothetical protein
MRDLINAQLKKLDNLRNNDIKHDGINDDIFFNRDSQNLLGQTSIGNASATIGQSLQHLQSGLYNT